MSDRPEPMYVGNGKEVETKSGLRFMRVELDIDQLGEHLRGAGKEFIRTWHDRSGTEHRTISLDVMPLKEPTQYRTHSVKIDTWKPDPDRKPAPKSDAWADTSASMGDDLLDAAETEDGDPPF